MYSHVDYYAVYEIHYYFSVTYQSINGICRIIRYVHVHIAHSIKQ